MKHKILFSSAILIVLFFTCWFALNLLLNYPVSPSQVHYNVRVAFPSLWFDHPVGIYDSGDGTNRLFVVGQLGIIYVFENKRSVTEMNVFLDMRNRVHLGAFLGLAFDPNFAENGHFYVNYLMDNPLRTVIAQWSVNPNNPNEADKNSQKILLEIPQLFDSHAGGQLAFGPDGYLYIALGDGNPYGDLSGNAQNRSSLHGKILRIELSHPSEGRAYGIPADNPYSNNTAGYREEIYGYGFRNPWRFSFDSANGRLWAGDDGQDRMEEIDIVEKGKNYGWNIMEGTLPYSSDGNQIGLEFPIWEYGRNQGNATIGGFVYRGTKLTELIGNYIYGDYVSGRIWALNYKDLNNIRNIELLKTDLNITSFGIDEKNELYVCSQDGRIYEITK
ncbi:MAG: PQQ-dependent sugar dehydrogenase [Ignavibacteria bacterium]